MKNEPRMKCFVFGSNLAGRHGAGAARSARLFWGAIYGRGVGMQGVDYATPSRCSYAIPTKDRELETLPLDRIEDYVSDFIVFASAHPEIDFQVTAIGCGLAGYRPADIAHMFAAAPWNCDLPNQFKKELGR